ncbi:MAG: mechanosensitive ion channel family protein [Halanaeroarchaeum sp.]
MAVPELEAVLADLWAAGWIQAAIVLVASYWAGRLIVRVAGRRIARRFERPSVTRTALRLIRTSAIGVGVLVALALVGLPIQNIALSVTVFSAVLGLILAPIVGSVINGLFVLADQPYEIGDMIELVDRGQRGFVEDITLRYTKIFTVDNTFLVIPNSSIRERDVDNYSAEDERTRLSITLSVTYEGDLEQARSIMVEAARAVDGVIGGGPDIRIGSARYPATPVCHIQEYGDHGVHLLLRFWADEPYRQQAVQSDVREEVWDRIQAADDVEVAYPHTHHVFDETSGTASVRMESEGG